MREYRSDFQGVRSDCTYQFFSWMSRSVDCVKACPSEIACDHLQQCYVDEEHSC